MSAHAKNKGIFEQLPTVHQMRDAEAGEMLRGLLQVIQQQALAVEENIRLLYQNGFAETSQPWAVSYLGELVGIQRPAADTFPDEELTEREAARQSLLHPRGEVARAVAQYRRKGTLSVLESLSNRVAKWPARAVEYFKLVNQLQSIADPHPEIGGLADVRDANALDLMESPFEKIAHMTDVRNIRPVGLPGRFNQIHVGLHVWRVKNYPLSQTTPKCLCVYNDDRGGYLTVYSFNPVGIQTQLFTNPVREPKPTSIAGELNVPAPIRLEGLRDKEKPDQVSANYYGEDKSIAVFVREFSGTHLNDFVPRQRVIPVNLGGLAAETKNACDCARHPQPADTRNKELVATLIGQPDKIAIDPVHGLLAIPRKFKRNSVRVNFQYGFSSDIGGGEYRRRKRYRAPVNNNRRIRVHCHDNLSDESRCRLDGLFEQHSADSRPRQLDWNDVWIFDCLPEQEETRPGGFVITFDPQPANTTTLTGTCRHKNGRPVKSMNFQLLIETFDNPVNVQAGRWEKEIPAGLLKPKLQILLTIDQQEQQTWHARRGQVLGSRQSLVLIEISDSQVYSLGGPKTICLNHGQTLEIRSSDRKRPLINLVHDHCESGFSVKLAPGSELTLDGIALSGGFIEIGNWPGISGLENNPSRQCQTETMPTKLESPCVNIRDCTINPPIGQRCDSGDCRGRNALNFDLPDGIIRIENCIVGSLESIPKTAQCKGQSGVLTRLSIADSIVCDTGNGALCGSKSVFLRASRTTFLGKVNICRVKTVEDCIFTKVVSVKQTQLGGFRFCYLPLEDKKTGQKSTTPPRYYCQPDLTQRTNFDRTRTPTVVPKFTSRNFGDPGFAQLALDCPREIFEGAEDGSEMGAFHDLYQAQRAANLRSRLDEFTPVSMTTEIIYGN